MATASQLSYPLNSENARPPGTFTVYLSCAAKATPPNTASAIALALITTLLFSIANPLGFKLRWDTHSQKCSWSTMGWNDYVATFWSFLASLYRSQTERLRLPR